MNTNEIARKNLAQLKKLHYYAEAEGFEAFIWRGQPIPVEVAKRLIADSERLINNTYDPDEYTD